MKTTYNQQCTTLQRAVFDLLHKRAYIRGSDSEYKDEILAQIATDLDALREITETLRKTYDLQRALSAFTNDPLVIENDTNTDKEEEADY